ncbi:MAG: PAS domain S-box protein [Lentisphaerae bacterium]|nr:PAS domain S-box protein [Lentisphaerota bacterium]
MKTGFFDKLIDRLDKLDPQSLQAQFLRLARERGLLETIFQSIREGVIVITGTGAISYANRAAETLMGFALEEARGRPISRFLKEIDWDRVLSLDVTEWSRLISTEIEVTYPEHRLLDFYVVPLSPEYGEEGGAVVILRDVLKARRQEETLIESERLNAVKLLAAGVAHEIGNPLNALNIHLQLLDREIGQLAEGGGVPARDADNLRELVDVAKKEVSRLDLIITQFLRAIRPATPKLAPARIDALLKETLTLLKEEIQNRHIEVEIVCPDALPRIRVDRNQIKQAFFNIIRNAFQAMPDGGSLTISLAVTDPYFSIAFEDTGVGIEPEAFGRIFDPYYSSKSEGSGLGLMIVQRIIQDHGGQIEVESKPQTGTRFTLLLPLAERRVRLLEAGNHKGDEDA